MATKRPTLGDAAVIRRYYEKRKGITSAAKAREDVLRLLEERKALQRAGEALLHAAIPFSGDPGVKAAIEEMRAVLEGRTTEAAKA